MLPQEEVELVGNKSQQSSSSFPFTSSNSSKASEWPERKAYGGEAWGTPIETPGGDDPDRLRVFVQPGSMSLDEQESILSRWKAKTFCPGSGAYSGLDNHLRPSTPSLERAQNQLKRLRDVGEEITSEAEDLIVDQYSFNNGFLESLRHYCQGETHVPVAYANELIRMIERLKVEMATQAKAADDKRWAEWEEYMTSHEYLAPKSTQMENNDLASKSVISDDEARRLELQLDNFQKERQGRNKFEAGLKKELRALQKQLDKTRVSLLEAEEAAQSRREKRQLGFFQSLGLIRMVMQIIKCLTALTQDSHEADEDQVEDNDQIQNSESSDELDVAQEMALLYS